MTAWARIAEARHFGEAPFEHSRSARSALTSTQTIPECNRICAA